MGSKDAKAIIRENMKVDISYHRQASVDYHKGSVEFSKIATTHLIILNSSSLLLLPAAGYYLGEFANLKGHEKVELIGPSIALLLAGCLCGVLCSLLSYYNYQQLAEKHLKIADVSNGILNSSVRGSADDVNRHMNGYNDFMESINKKIYRTYLAAHLVGWVSMVAFISSFALIGLKMYIGKI